MDHPGEGLAPAPRRVVISAGPVIVVGLALLLVTAGAAFWLRAQRSPRPAFPVHQPAVGVDITPEGFPLKGSLNAPVTMVEFSDFQCPFCRQFATESLPLIEGKYIRTGLVRFIYRDFAIQGPESQWAAEAAYCAQEQGAYWPYHDLLFARQAGQNSGAFSQENLKFFAAELGLDTQLFADCLDSGRYAAMVQAATQEGRSLGLEGTPTFFVDGRKVEGALPFEKWDQLFSLYAQQLGR